MLKKSLVLYSNAGRHQGKTVSVISCQFKRHLLNVILMKYMSKLQGKYVGSKYWPVVVNFCFVSFSSKHVHFQQCECFVSKTEKEVVALQLKWIWFRLIFGLLVLITTEKIFLFHKLVEHVCGGLFSFVYRFKKLQLTLVWSKDYRIRHKLE
jgi:hypothetical protein